MIILKHRPAIIARFLSNAGANVAGGIITASYQLVITGIATRTWQGNYFSTWALALSIAAIVPVFAFNLSSVITRRLVECFHAKHSSQYAAVLSAGRIMQFHLAGISFIILLCCAIIIYKYFDSAALDIYKFLLLSVVLILGNLWVLFSQVNFGRYYACEQNWGAALIQALARLGGIGGIAAGIAISHASLGGAAIGLSLGTWVGLYLARLLPINPYSSTVIGNPDPGDIRQQYKSNAKLLAGFAVGGLSLIVVQYSVPPMIAMLAPSHFNAFYIANAINLIAVGALAAAMSAMLAPLTRWRSVGAAASLRLATLLSPAASALACLSVLGIFWVGLEPLLSAMHTRAASVHEVRFFLGLLGLQTIVRNAAGGYAMYIASVGNSRQMAAPLIIEICIAIGVAIPLGWIYGAPAMLAILILSSLVGSLYTCRIVAAFPAETRIPALAALASLMGAQVTFSLAWWTIVSLTP